MKVIKFILAVYYLFLAGFQVSAQNLVMRKLTAEDKKNKIHRAYEFNATDHYTAIKLCLYQSGVFYYTLSSFDRNVFSEGKWVAKKDTLILTNNIRNRHISIKLIYSKDSTTLINGFKIGIVKNLKGQEMSDGLVAINNNSNICLPSYGGMCRGEYTSIDSIKIVFENGLSSDWLKIDNKEYKQVIPIVQTNFLMSSYMVFDNEKYLIKKSLLKPIE